MSRADALFLHDLIGSLFGVIDIWGHAESLKVEIHNGVIRNGFSEILEG